MRFLRSLLFALAASSPSISANALRQHQQRSLVDICANVDADFGLLGITYGRLELCICVSGIPALLETNAVLQNAVLVGGQSATTAAVNALINGASDHQQCNYPQYSTPYCGANPCDFYCDTAFTPYPPVDPTDCVCEYPNTICNGVCGYFPYCSSQKVKRDAKWRDATCPHGWSACGIWGGSRLDYECVDVTADLWSCGGCGIPLLSTDPVGVDCTAIPGVHDVSCLGSRCVVQRCKSGFTVSDDKTTCIPTTRMTPNIPVLINNGAGPFKARET
ncbi:hypothetical protein K439DRAFT_1386452 [Ramaria rubella]|nr:hypothetical protein K439DRAFT_1386452 [Ramaria rubella]